MTTLEHKRDLSPLPSSSYPNISLPSGHCAGIDKVMHSGLDCE